MVQLPFFTLLASFPVSSPSIPFYLLGIPPLAWCDPIHLVARKLTSPSKFQIPSTPGQLCALLRRHRDSGFTGYGTVPTVCASIHAGPNNWTYVFSALLCDMAIPADILAVPRQFQCNELKDLSVISIFLDVVPQTSHKIPLFHVPCLAICMHMYMRQNIFTRNTFD